MALSGVLIAAVRTGLTARLARSPATIAELASELDIEPAPTRLLLECLRAGGHVRVRSGRFELSRAGRRWLSPDAPFSVASFVAATSDYWTWWSGLDFAVRAPSAVSLAARSPGRGLISGQGTPHGHHDTPPDDPYWRRYILGQLDLARLCASEVARKLPLARGARSVLDIGGGHGWYSAELCRRHPGLSATVLDLPGSASVGRPVAAGAARGG
jgi:hypothetical protein